MASDTKRRKLDHRKSYDPADDSGDDLFSDIPDTVPTQPLYPVERKSSSKAKQSAFDDLLSSLDSTPPKKRTQAPLSSSSPSRSSPSVQVAASSPRKPASSNGFKFGSVANAMAPPGTAFRPPAGIQAKPTARDIVDLSFDDPPVDQISADEGDSLDTAIRPTKFTNARAEADHTEDRVEESPRPVQNDFSKLASTFTYSPGDSGRANGDQLRKAAPLRQGGPARALPVQGVDKLSNVTDPIQKGKLQEMLTYYPDIKVQILQAYLSKKKGNVPDALDYIGQQQDALELIEDAQIRDKVQRLRNFHAKFAVEVLQGHLANKGNDFNLALHTLYDLDPTTVSTAKPPPAAAPRAKQQVGAPQRTIAAKWTSRPQQKTSPVKPHPTLNLPDHGGEPVPKVRRRLVQGSRSQSASASRENSPPVETISRKRQVISIESDEEGDAVSSAHSSEPEAAPTSSKLLAFFNTCTALELADLANEKQDVAEQILLHRPFKSYGAIRAIDPLGNSKKRPIGDRILDVCQDMWAGYAAVDSLVERCEAYGKPIREAMKSWGVDVSTDGELASTKIDDPHDSGIGTPASTLTADDDSPRKTYLKQPAIMSNDLVMKDYQVFGLNWLNLLWTKKLSCILADDMGLGKTCQVIAFLSHLRETGGTASGTHLIVVPGSTLENWLREFQRFSPELDVRPYYGSQKEREELREEIESELRDIDIIVTTYETATGQRPDNKFLRKVVKPTVCVFDEGHALKNSSTKRHQELMRIPAKFRLLLTGTPLQNNLQELVSLLNFILPQVFEEHQEQLESIFKYKATTKDADHAALLSAQRIQRARSMMTPFVLRRKKQQVLKDIPAKHRRVEYCDMVDTQKKLWASCVDNIKQARLEPTKGKAKNSSVHMMALRQAALHPLLTRQIYTADKLRKLQSILIEHPLSDYNGNRADLVSKFLTTDLKGGDFGLHKFCSDRADYIPSRYILQKEEWMQSGKVQKLKELMERFIANGDRVLLFSQFTSMMDILEAVFETLSIKFMRLDGSTQMATRQDMIDKFTDDTSIPVFMLSTKAGGAGINLACANKVIIFDSSFNPQDDIQAENRAHRVGQTREVEVVRLVTRGTIEEMIHKLGESKLALDERVAGEGAATTDSAPLVGGDGADSKQADRDGEKRVEEMFLSSLDKDM